MIPRWTIVIGPRLFERFENRSLAAGLHDLRPPLAVAAVEQAHRIARRAAHHIDEIVSIFLRQGDRLSGGKILADEESGIGRHVFALAGLRRCVKCRLNCPAGFATQRIWF